MRFQQVVKRIWCKHVFLFINCTGVLGYNPTGSFDPQEQSIGIIIDGDITAQAGVMAGFA